MDLHCPSCRGAVDGSPHAAAATRASTPLAPDGTCTQCGHAWPSVPAWGRQIHVVHRDERIAEHLRRTVAHLNNAALDQPDWLASLSQDDATWAQSLWTWGPAHLGAYLDPPVPQPDLSWVRAFLDDLDDLPPGPVLLLGGALGGEALALPEAWTATPGDGSKPVTTRTVVCLESHPWLLAGAAMATSTEPRLGVLRRPGALERRPLRLPADVQRRLARTHLVLGDAHDPPFGPNSFAVIIALNVVDSVRDPWTVMGQCEAMLKTDGALLVSSPWHFQPEITADSLRLDRGLPLACDLPWLIAGRLTGAALPGVLDGLALQHLERDLPWRLQLHDRLAWDYRVDALLLRRVDTTN